MSSSSNEKGDKIKKKFCLMRKAGLLKEVEYDEVGTVSPVIFLRDHIVGGKSLYDELAECEINLDPEPCINKYPLAEPGTEINGNGSKDQILAIQDHIEGKSHFDAIAERQVNLEHLAEPAETAETIIKSAGAGNTGYKIRQRPKRRPNCGPKRLKNRRTLNSLKTRDRQCIPVIRLIELSTYIVKVIRMLLKYNDIMYCSLSFNPAERNPFARFTEMKSSLDHIAQKLNKVLRKYGGQNEDDKLPIVNETDDFQARNKDPKGTLWIVFKLMGKVKERLPDTRLAQKEFLLGLEIFIRLIEKYPFQYFYENRFVLPCPPAAEIPEIVPATLIQRIRQSALNPSNILNILKNSIGLGCFCVLVAAIGSWILYE